MSFDSQQICLVDSFQSLMTTKFEGYKNAIYWRRNLIGNFKEITNALELKENVTEVSIDDLIILNLSAQGEMARDIIINDIKSLTCLGASPSLNLIKCYERDDELNFISTDVYSFHVDRSPIETDTILCTYYGAASDIIPNNQVQQKILIPEIRSKLLDLYDGPKTGFNDFLKEYYFDLHYQPNEDAVPINLGQGHMWRLAVDHPTQQVLPCVHRAPKEIDGELRLLLIC